MFKVVPAYNAPSRSGLSNSKSRHDNEAQRLDKQRETFFKTVLVENFDDLISKKLEQNVKCLRYKMYQTQWSELCSRSERICTFNLGNCICKKSLYVTVFRGQQTILHSFTLTFCY